MANRIKQDSTSGYWRFCQWLVVACLTVWLVVTLVPLALAQMDVTGTILGWPAVFAVAAFGVPLLYLAIIGIYSLAMDRVEQDEHGHEGEP